MLPESLLLLVLLTQTCLAHTVLYVDGSASTEPIGVCTNRSSPCPTLEFAMNQTRELNNSVAVVLLSSRLILDDPILLDLDSRITEFHLKGRDDSGTVITCSTISESLSGFYLVGLDNVTISNITVSGCGLHRFYDKNIFSAVFHFMECNNVIITKLNVIDNRGTGIAIVYPENGTTSISYSKFSSNYLTERDTTYYFGGAGVAAYVLGKNTTQVAINVFECTFEHNRATSPNNYTDYDVYQPYSGSGKGGGFSAYLWYDATKNSVNISDCVFFNNTAYYGGGLYILLSDNSVHNNMIIERCKFYENGCVEELRGSVIGGGAVIAYKTHRNETFTPHHNHILIKDSEFLCNCAHFGGGLAFIVSRTHDSEASTSNTFLLDNCSWTKNRAHIGAAVDISPHVMSRVKEGFLQKLCFRDCRFTDNFVLSHELGMVQSYGSGVLFSSLVNVDFENFVLFERNNGSAVVIVNGMLNFSECDAVFVGNTGVQGGAISLTGVSAMIIGPGRTYNFTDNSATDRGGAIYNYLIDDHDFAASRSCFITCSEYQLLRSKWDVIFYFIDNNAGTYGNSIFSSSISSCVDTEQQQSDDETTIFRWPEVFHYDNRTDNHIATEGGIFNVSETQPILLIPGNLHVLQIVMNDDFEQEIETIFHASSEEDSIEIDDAYSCVSGNAIVVRGEAESSGVLLLETISSRKVSIRVNVTLLPCPAGFVMDQSQNECICSTDRYSAILCDTTEFQASIKLGYWAAYVENDTLVTGTCPLAFCGYSDKYSNRDSEVPIPKDTAHSHLDDFICGPTRSGILCGSCKPGYSAFYHSPQYTCRESKHCKWGWILYILSELVPVTAMFVAVLVFSINFTSGRISGFILFSQLLDFVTVNRNSVVAQPESVSCLTWGYQLIYGVFKMEFFNIEPLAFCLWEGATVLDVLAFRYVTIVYAFLLVLLTLLLLKYRGHVLAGKYIRITTIKNSVVHGLSAFIILCYAETTKISIYLLISGYVKEEYGRIWSKQVFFNGEIDYFSKGHLPYAMIALFSLVTICIIPPVFLILYPSVNKILAFCKLSDTKTVKRVSKIVPISKLKPFLDSFQGCFNDHLRFFAGIYFLYRWIPPLLFALLPTVTGFYYESQKCLHSSTIAPCRSPTLCEESVQYY